MEGEFQCFCSVPLKMGCRRFSGIRVLQAEGGKGEALLTDDVCSVSKIQTISSLSRTR